MHISKIHPVLKATAALIMKAGSSKSPWGNRLKTVLNNGTPAFYLHVLGDHSYYLTVGPNRYQGTRPKSQPNATAKNTVLTLFMNMDNRKPER